MSEREIDIKAILKTGIILIAIPCAFPRVSTVPSTRGLFGSFTLTTTTPGTPTATHTSVSWTAPPEGFPKLPDIPAGRYVVGAKGFADEEIEVSGPGARVTLR